MTTSHGGLRRPLILISPDVERTGPNPGDWCSSTTQAYQDAILQAGGLLLTMPASANPDVIGDCVRRCDGVLIPGGEDVDPQIYGQALTGRLAETVKVTPDGGIRDYREIRLVEEVFRQRKPLLAICRGIQLLNVALGGTLIADIPSQRPNSLQHRRMDAKREIVHEVRLTPDSLLARIVASRKLGVNSTHHQAVGRVARRLKVVATSSDGIVEGLELSSRAGGDLPFLLAVQFHPERLVDRYPEHQAIFGAFTEACRSGRS